MTTTGHSPDLDPLPKVCTMSFLRIRPIRLLVVVLAIALVAAACGGSDADLAAPIAEPTAEQPAPVDDAILTTVDQGSVAFGGNEPIDFDATELVFDDTFEFGPAFFGIYTDADGEGYVALPVDLAAQGPTGEIIVFTPNGDELRGEGAAFDEDGVFITASTELTPTQGAAASTTVDLRVTIGAGTSTFELQGNQAIVRGELGSATFDQMTHLIEAHPEVDTLVLLDVPGSVNDEVNVETGRLVRAAGYTTHVPANGEIYSGGVDLFAAGATRTAEAGATIGVHAWCCGDDGESAHLIAQDDDAHAFQLAYFREMLGPDLGPAFYFFTLQAAPFESVDPMTPAELEYFDLVTANAVLGEAQDVTTDIASLLSADVASPDAAAAVVLAADGAPDGAAVILSLDEPVQRVLVGEPTGDEPGSVLTLTFAPGDGSNLLAAVVQTITLTSTTLTTALDLSVGELPSALAPLAGVFSQHIDVWGVHVVGTAATDPADLRHAANVMAQYLDNDADGQPDVPAVVETMVANNATLLMAATPDEFESLDGAELDQVFDFVGRGGQDLYGSETNPANGFDASLEEVHHLILNTGWSVIYPDALTVGVDSELAAAMDIARGGRFDAIPASYPNDAWFTYDDQTCDYTCMLTEYFYWAHTSILGGQTDRADEIGHEWKLETPQKVRDVDVAVTALIEALPLPTQLPDGVYLGSQG